MEKLQRCTKCKEEKPASAFYLRATTPYLRRRRCAECMTKANLQRRKVSSGHQTKIVKGANRNPTCPVCKQPMLSCLCYEYEDSAPVPSQRDSGLVRNSGYAGRGTVDI